MDVVDQDFPCAPGCFASALTYKHDAPECETCSFAAACGPRSKKRLEELRAKFGIELPVEKSSAPKKVADAGFFMPVKVAALLEKITTPGVDLAERIKSGVNPFLEKGPKFMALSTHLLIRCENGIDRKHLVAAMQAKLNWTHETAAAHALQAVQALIALGAADEINGRFYKRKSND